VHILIADKFEPAGVQALENLGCRVTLNPDLGPETLPEALPGVQVLIVRSTKVPAKVIKAADALAGIIRAGAGYDNIDVAAATEAGVSVCNCPGTNSVAVAELAMAHLLCCDRRVHEQTADLRGGKWRKKEYAQARGLKGSTLGIIGVGYIGRALIDRAKAFQMKIVAWSEHMTVDRARELGVGYGGSDRSELLDMLPKCDAVSIHVSANPTTNGLCDAEFFDAMKDGAYFINTARGSVVDEAALRDAVKAKGLRVGLDVYQNQPPTPEADWDCPLADLPGASLTHHVGASTDQAQAAVADETVRIVREFMATGKFIHRVNGE
jgi:D-3-phosphoglycerate dehydrogenase / 2-oxoglutarate reductase